MHFCEMFKKLQQHWGTGGWRFFFILCTFAITGTFTAWVSRQITLWLDVTRLTVAWWLLKIGVLFIGYQLFILFFGFCLGQFSFFWNYEKKILRRIGIIKKQKKICRLAIFASGAGTNAKNIIDHFAGSDKISIALIVSNKIDAGVLEIARVNKLDTFLTKKEDVNGKEILSILKNKEIDMIILAGYLWQLPPLLVQTFPKKIINIHPALLPKYGGKGMYGIHVHTAVISNKEQVSGITIHYVDEIYDHGEIILQVVCPVAAEETPVTLAQKIHVLEHLHYPRVINEILQKQNRS